MIKPIIIALVIVALAVPVVNVNASSKPEIVSAVPTGGPGSGTKCPDGYDRMKGNDNCELRDVQCDEDPDHSLCTGERGREGSIFCDVLYQETGGKAGGCYDRNDTPDQHCDKYTEEESSRESIA